MDYERGEVDAGELKRGFGGVVRVVVVEEEVGDLVGVWRGVEGWEGGFGGLQEVKLVVGGGIGGGREAAEFREREEVEGSGCTAREGEDS